MLIVSKDKNKEDIDLAQADHIRMNTSKNGEDNKEIMISKGTRANYYKYVDSALIKDIKWDLMEAMKMNDLKSYDDMIKKSYCSKEYLRSRYPTEEEYKRSFTKFSTYAVLTPDGEWYEPGQVGWWGTSSASPEQEMDFEKNYEEKFIKAANPEWKLTIVDCHI